MRVIDSHTGGQPTRLILSGGPDLGSGPLNERRQRFADEFDQYRRGALLEPKCPDSAVGALLCEPTSPDYSAGIIFFNTAGFLGMCGHGVIGAAVSLAHLGLLDLGKHKLDTPVGDVNFELLDANQVRIENVESYCSQKEVTVDVEGYGPVTGSVAWGGNWFFLVDKIDTPIHKENIPHLTDLSWRIRHALEANGISGDAGGVIDHIELMEPVETDEANNRSFVLCPSGAYDRSPCGTGTSAKMACLAEAGLLSPGETWVQESVIGSRFKGVYRNSDTPGNILPTVTGSAYVFADSTLIFSENDPFRWGIV